MTEDILSSPGRNDPCWCGSGRKYKQCHGYGPRFGPGAPVPSGTPEGGGRWIGPDIAMDEQALDDLAAQTRGAPIYGPSEKPELRPLVVNSLSEMLGRVQLPGGAITFGQIAIERIDALDGMGLGSEDESYLARRLSELSPADRSDLARALFRSARSTLDRLDVQRDSPTPPTALWAPHGDAGRLVGQTLLWADHYLTNDRTLEALLRRRDPDVLSDLAGPLASEAALRPLLEAGIVALVPEETAHVMVADHAYERATSALQSEGLADWVMSQLEIEGPTEPEVIFVAARDSNDRGQTFFLNRVEGHQESGDSLLVSTSMLAHQYDPAHDYGPWIQQTKRQVAARHVQDMEFAVATAEVLGGQLLATSPFEARLLARQGHAGAPTSALAWADIPSLPDSDPATLARIAAEDETVEALRQTVRRGMFAAEHDDPQEAARELGIRLREDAEVLNRQIRDERRWKLVAPGAVGVVGIGIGALAGPIGVAAAALGLGATLLPSIADRRADRRNAAYAVVLADRSRRQSR